MVDRGDIMSAKIGEIFTEDELRKFVIGECERSGSQRKFAVENDLSPQYVNDVVNGHRGPGEKIAKIFGLRPMVVYVDIKS